MKTLWQVISLLAVVHILGLAGFVGFLAGTDRINAERVELVRDTFMLTVAEEQAEEEELAAVAADAESTDERVATASDIDDPAPVSVAERLAQERAQNEATLRQIERTRKEVEDLRRNLKLAQERVQKQHDQLMAEKKAVEEKLTQIEQRLNDEGFKKAVQLYEALPAKQTKQMFVKLIGEGQIEQVVMYMEAMESRKAGGVMKEFKSEADLAMAVDIAERLRARGTHLVSQAKGVQP